jgi:DNA-binding MarR family transcriptional regulator
VAPLVDCGLVVRVPNPDDGRAVLLELSDQGRTRLEEVRTSRRELMRMLTDDWSEEDQQAFCTLLTRFNLAIKAHHRTS